MQNAHPQWKDHTKGFAVQKTVCDWEGQCLSFVAAYHQLPCIRVTKPSEVPNGFTPSGTVSWIAEVLGTVVTPDYFPAFLSSWVKRNVWREEKWPLRRVFIKPADRHKRFNSFVTSGTYRGKKKGPFICSDIQHFVDEWRYYVAYGKLIGGYWYWGDGMEEKPAPELNITYPADWCGTADFGRTYDGQIKLIESHPPFACGWYGKKHDEYAEFLVMGWKWLKENYEPPH